MQQENLYSVLNIPKQASFKEIKESYRKLVKENHPDKHFGDVSKEDFLKKINNAYQVLSDAKKKKEYDIFQMQSSFILPTEMEDIFQTFQSNIFMGFNTKQTNIFEDEIFNSINKMFNTTNYNKTTISPTQDLEICVTFEDCYTGGCVKKHIKRQILNKIIFEDIYIKIPKGVTNGSTKIIKEKGDLIPNYTIAGDLKITFKITKHKLFKKFESDLILEKDILLSEALYGFSFNVCLPNKKHIQINCSNIITPKTSTTIDNLGFPIIGSDNICGHLHIIFNIIFPDMLEEKQKELLYKLLPKRKKCISKKNNIDNDNNDNDNNDNNDNNNIYKI